MKIASVRCQFQGSEWWIFLIGLVGPPFCLLVDYWEGYTGAAFSWLPPVGMLLFALYFAFVPVAVILCFGTLKTWKRAGSLSKDRIVWIGVLVAVGCICHFEGRLRASLHGFLVQLRARVSADAVQEAALRLLDGQTNGEAFVQFADEFGHTNLIPVFAREAFWSHPPRFAGLVPATQHSGGYLWMEKGGHFVGYVGLGAGPDEFRLSGDFSGEAIQWKPGVYVWWRSEFEPPPISVEQIAPPETPLSVSGSITPVHRPLDSLPAPGSGGGR